MVGGARTRSLVASFAVFAVALVVPLVTLAIVAAMHYAQSERERLTAIGQLTGDHLRERVDRDLAAMTAIARTLATSPAIDLGDYAAFDAQARASVDVQDVSVTLAELDGRHLVNTRAKPGEALPIVPRPGLVATLARTKAPLVSGMLISAMTGRRIIGVQAPVIRDGLVTKVVSVVVRIEHFEKLIEQGRIGNPYSAAILDADGRSIARTRTVAHTEARNAGGAMAADGEAEEENASHEHEAARETIAYEHPSRHSGWTVVTGVDKAALEAPLQRSLALLAVIGLLLAGLCGLVALPLARRVAAAMRDLATAAETIGRGRLVSLNSSPIQEVDLVGKALAEASHTLAEQRASVEADRFALEARIEERGRALDTSRAHYRVLAENVGDVIVMRRQGSHALSYVSPSSTKVFGYEPDAIKGFAFGDNIHPDDVAAVAAVDTALGAGQQGVTCLFRTRRQDGNWIWVESVTNRIASAGPDDPDVISVLRDVTERQRHAEELRLARDMAELAQAKAENANRSKSEFLAVMSHEIRTPLSTIRGFSELLADTAPLSAEQSRYIALIDDASKTMLTAVDDIIDFAKIEAGDLRVDPRPFGLAGAIEGVAGFLRPAAASRGMAVGATLAPELPTYVLGDERRLRQILLNLLNTLLRARRGGIVTVSVHRRHGTDAQGRIGFTLTATGGRASASDAGGLGPTIAQRLIGLMGGRLETIAGGLEPSSYRFSLALPAAEALAPVQEMPASVLGRPVRLLLVDDHPVNREVACRMLERAGHTVDTANDGAQAVAAVQERSYDLVLMDVQMPGMDGLTATRRIRALQHPSRRIPILAVTANVLPEQIRGFREAGMNGHVAKPVDRKGLCAAVEAQLASTVVLESRAGFGEAPIIFDRAAYDGLVASLGPEGAESALRGFVVLLETAHGEDRHGLSVVQAEADTIAVAARRLGFLDLASAHARLAQVEAGPAGQAALQRAHVARDLARRVLDELSGAELRTPKNKVALL